MNPSGLAHYNAERQKRIIGDNFVSTLASKEGYPELAVEVVSMSPWDHWEIVKYGFIGWRVLHNDERYWPIVPAPGRLVFQFEYGTEENIVPGAVRETVKKLLEA